MPRVRPHHHGVAGGRPPDAAAPALPAGAGAVVPVLELEPDWPSGAPLPLLHLLDDEGTES
jgi:hypothetical protein